MATVSAQIRIDGDVLTLTLMDTGSHADLFR